MATGWNWDGFAAYLFNPYLIGGAFQTLWLTLAAIAGGLILGSMIAFARLSGQQWLSAPAALYTWVFRGTPLLVQLIILYTGLPQLGIRFSVIEAALIGLILNEAAYLAEIIRGGIAAVPRGQTAAAKALGLTSVQTMRQVVFPQAMRLIVPSLGNSVNGLLKTTSIASVISVEELLRRTQELIQERFMVLELFVVAALYYLLMTTVWSFFQRKIEAYYGRGYTAHGAGRNGRRAWFFARRQTARID
ncbi:amino acid ABC transporter permease [Paraburkholderia lacunae]|uniref:Glutamate/aspartate import permease protein GltK n=1 Tax=Paraburkholderia lacunae TaxID=2211104 RepID=A0A370NBM8_9BURK|nr:amino acid ABC transporter permease [Paraburkholderia lacunae]RDK02985.1 ABC transporter permease [Paraburkholderia lacunae]